MRGPSGSGRDVKHGSEILEEGHFWGAERKMGREKIQNLYLSKIPLILLSHEPSYCLKSTQFPSFT